MVKMALGHITKQFMVSASALALSLNLALAKETTKETTKPETKPVATKKQAATAAPQKVFNAASTTTPGAKEAKKKPFNILKAEPDKDGVFFMTRDQRPTRAASERAYDRKNVVIFCMGNQDKEDPESALYTALKIKKEYEGTTKYGDNLSFEIISLSSNKEMILMSVVGLGFKDENGLGKGQNIFTPERALVAAPHIPAYFRLTLEADAEGRLKSKPGKDSPAPQKTPAVAATNHEPG